MLVLHNYFRSSTSTRLRIALNLKGLEYRQVSYALLKQEHKSEAFLAKTPAGLVPALELAGGEVLTQSLAIVEYLDEVHPKPPLLPGSALGRAEARALAQMIALEVHPLNNLRVLRHLTKAFGAEEAAKVAWVRHWVHETFAAFEARLEKTAGRFCYGDAVTLPDLCLYAQMWNNKRFEVDCAGYPVIQRVFWALDQIPAFQDAAPPNQPDAT